jgi:hypothetical protein
VNAFSALLNGRAIFGKLFGITRGIKLKQKRDSPHVMLSGDRVFVPRIQSKELQRPTDVKNQFVRKGIPIELKLKIFREDEPRNCLRYVVSIEGRQSDGTVPENGVVNLKILP